MKINHPPLFLNNIQVSQFLSHTHRGIIFDEQLACCKHLKMLTLKINKTTGLLPKLQKLLPRSALITIYKAFLKPHFYYGDIIYDEAYNTSFHHKLAFFWYNACLAITWAIRGTSKEKLYQEIGLEFLQLRRLFRKLCFFYKIYKSYQPSYLSNMVSQQNFAFNTINTRNVNKVPLFKIKHNFFKNFFFPSINCYRMEQAGS